MIAENVRALLGECHQNALGEPVTLVAATKTRSEEEIREAIEAGITDVGENRAQELRDKYAALSAARVHFIGRLQPNKIKYVVGKAALIHSVDSDGLALAIARRAEMLGIRQDILLEVNIGGEESKGGYAPEEVPAAYERLKGEGALRIRGLMAMLPKEGDLASLADRMRALYEEFRGEDFSFLSMGMSADWKLCLGHGANMIRLGTAIFGERK